MCTLAPLAPIAPFAPSPLRTHRRQHPAPRHLRPIQGALRLFMTDTLGRLGWRDVGDAIETHGTLAQLDALLDMCRSHLAHENALVQTALQARRPGASRSVAGEHVE